MVERQGTIAWRVVYDPCRASGIRPGVYAGLGEDNKQDCQARLRASFASHKVNEQLGLHGKKLQWQTGYGVVSFGTGDMDWVKDYIRNQRDHHARGRAYDRLERITELDA